MAKFLLRMAHSYSREKFFDRFVEVAGQKMNEATPENYLEARLEGKHPYAGGLFTVTFQRCDGKTPHALRLEAEKRADEAEDAVHRLNAERRQSK